MLSNYVYLNFGRKLGKDLISLLVDKYLYYERIIDIGEDFVLITFDTSDGGTSTAWFRHLRLSDDNWVVSASYNIFKESGCTKTGFIILGEILSMNGKKVSYQDIVFKCSTNLIVDIPDEEVKFLTENFREDRKILERSTIFIEGKDHTQLTLDDTLLVQAFEDEADRCVDILKELF